MTPRRIGSTDIETPPMILGGNVFGWTATVTPALPSWTVSPMRAAR